MIDAGNRQPTTLLKTGVMRKHLWSRPNLLLREFLQVTLIMSVTTGTAWGIGQIMSPANVLMVLLVGVLIAATRSSPGPAIWSAILGLAGYNYLFTEPRYTLFMHHYDDILTALFFLFVAIISGNLAVRLRQQIQALKAARQATETLYTLSLKLMASPDPKTILLTGMQFLQQQFGRYIVMLLPDSERQLTPVAGNQIGAPEPDANDLAAADRAWRNAKPGTQSGTNWIWQPLISERGALAVLGMQRVEVALLPEQERLLDALVREIALALERSYLTEDLESARIQGETEQLRSALLSSVSHDLRTPLSTMIGSVSSLLQYRGQLSDDDEKDLLESTLSEAERLNRYIQNLLDMTRLGYGRMKLTRSWVAMEDIIASAIQRLHSVLNRLQVHTWVGEGIPLLFVHAALIEQALVNILENAARFSPPDSAIEIEARMYGKDLELTVTDQGPGIPEDERAKIFDMFYTVKKGDRINAGTGLGLAICQGMIGAHGGRIEALAGPHGKGTKIRVMLPLENQPAMPDEADD
jgi:two-component system sensor histidine kinase KdpD